MIENESQPTLKYHFVPGFVGCRTQYIHQESSKCLLCAYGNLFIGYLVKAICTVPRLARKEFNVPKLKGSQGLTKLNRVLKGPQRKCVCREQIVAAS